MSQLFASGGQSIGVSASALVLPMNIQGWFPFRLTGLISLMSKGLSRVFSSTTIFLYGLSFLYGPILTSVHDCWENHSFGSTDLCQQSNVSALVSYVCHKFSSKKQASFNFMAAATIHSDFLGAQENKIRHYFHFFPNYLSWSTGTRCHDLSFFNIEF